MSTLSDHNKELARIKQYNLQSNVYNSRDPDRYYLEEYFKQLPKNSSLFTVLKSRGTLTTDTDTEESLANTTIKGNTLKEGDVIHIVGMATVIDGSTADTSTAKLTIGTSATGGTAILTSTALDVITNNIILIDAYITVRTIGSTGTIIAHGTIKTGTDGSTLLNGILAETTVDTENDLILSFTNQWSDGDTSNDIAADTFIVDIMNYSINPSFELVGTDNASGTIVYSSTVAGIQLTTDSTDNDQMIIQPNCSDSTKTNTNRSAWESIKWGTENQVIWECAIRTDFSIDTMAFWAGLKKTNTANLQTDNDQAYFLYTSASDMNTSGGITLTTPANLHFIYSVGGTDYVTDLNIVVAVNTIYKLKIMIDKDRKVSVYVNGKVYGLTTSEGTNGTTVSNTGQKSKELTNHIDLIPYVGVQTIDSSNSATSTITLCYEKISRILFE